MNDQRQEPTIIQIRLLVIGHALVYLGTMLTVAMQNERPRYVIYVGAAFQMLAGITSLLRFDVLRQFRGFPILLATLLYLAFLVLFGLFHDNWFSFWAYDAAAFGILASIHLGTSFVVQEQLRRLYRNALFPGLLVASVLMTYVRPASIGARLDTDLEYSVYGIVSLALPSYLLLFQKNLSRSEILVTGWGLGLAFIFGIFTASRGVFLMVPLALVLRVVLFRRSRRSAIAMVVGALAITAGAVALDATRAVGAATQNIEYRLRGGDGDLTSGRGAEAEYFLLTTNGSDFVIGRGLGGAYKSVIQTTSPYGMSIVHYTHLYLILKGGVVLLALMGLLTGIPLFGALRAGQLRPELGYLVLFLFANTGHPQFVDFISTGLFALTLGGLGRRQVSEEPVPPPKPGPKPLGKAFGGTLRRPTPLFTNRRPT